MANILCRTIILYLIIVLLMRLSGKREIGQMELTELVTAFMVSELASIPISDNDIPLLYGIIPTVTLICLEVFLSYLCTKSKKARIIFSGYPEILVDKGSLNQKALSDARLTVEELLSSLRVLGYGNLSDVYYAILEPSGNISVIPKCTQRPPTTEELNIKADETGVQHVIISDGKINMASLHRTGLDVMWVDSQLKKQGIKSRADVFFFGVDDSKKVMLIPKKEKRK